MAASAGCEMNNVSVIITTYNQAPWVAQAVESVLAQRFPAIEVVVVDDGSTDGTPGVFTTSSGSVVYLRQSHQGIMAARLAGLEASKGAFVIFMQAEDLMSFYKLEAQVKRLEKQPELGLVYFGRPPLDWERVHFIWEVPCDRSVLPNSSVVAAEFFLSGGPLIRRDCIERIGFREAALDPDSNWNPWERLTLAGYDIDPGERLTLCESHLDIFFRKLVAGECGPAQRHLIEAARLCPSVIESAEILLNFVLECAKRLETNDPVDFVQMVFANLPEEAQMLRRYESRVIAKLSIAKAFQEFRLGNMTQVRRNVWESIIRDPSYLTNKGVASIFGWSFLCRNSNFRAMRRINEESDLPPSVVTSVQETLGQSVSSVERAVGGTNCNTYVIRGEGPPCILRLVKAPNGSAILRWIIAVMERVRAHGVPTPRILASSFPPPGSPELAWVVEEWMPGYAFAPQNMRWRDALSVAADLGQCLRKLHSIETAGFGWILSERLEAKYQSFDRWLESSILGDGQTLDRLPADLRPRLEAAYQFLRTSYRGTPRLCHCDINYGNFLVSGGHVTAMIDWDGASGCDPAFDVAIFHFWEDDEQILSALLETYAPVEPVLFRRRVTAGVICHAAALLAWDFSKQTIDREAIYRRCLEWLTDSRVLSSFR
jgi:aminoglycoside phosphotransferase (APT) family kinase protein